jgi:urease accessory protein
MTEALRAVSHLPPGHGGGTPWAWISLTHDQRRLRRRLLVLANGAEVLVDLPATVTLDNGSKLQLEDGRLVGIVAAEEELYSITGIDRAHLVRLAWHLGNRHLPAQLDGERILIRRDHVIRNMLTGLGAQVTAVTDTFAPEHGAYHGHAAHDHALLNR